MPTTTGKIYLGSTLVAGGAGGAGGWTRPADWPALPAVAASDQVFRGLHAVFDHESNFATIRCTGAFTVDWGDGSAPVNVASNTTAEYNYSYAASGLGGVTSRGYKTAIVTVTPQAGETLSAIDLSLIHTQTGLVNGHGSQWLDIRLAMNNVGTVTTYNINWIHRLLEQFEWVGGSSTQTNFSNFLSSCGNLQSVPLFDTSAGTSFNNFLSSCGRLQSVPLFNTSAGTNFISFMQGCFILQSVPLFDTSAGTSFSGFMQNCGRLQSVPLFNTSAGTSFSGFMQNCGNLQSAPLFNTSAGTNFGFFLNGCRNLQSVPLFDTSAGTNFSFFCSSCDSLQSVPLFNTSAGTSFNNFLSSCIRLQSVPLFNTSAGTNFSGFMQSCISLQSVPLFDTSAGTNFSGFMQSCGSLQSVPLFDTSAGTNFASFLVNCTDLSRIQATFPASQDISLANLSLGPAALNEVYTNLPIASGSPRTITVTGNWGTATHDPTIATAKGWTVVA